MMKKFFTVLLHPLLLAALGLLALALVIWHVGPLVSIAGHTPLEPENVRWALIGAVVLAYVLRVLFVRLKARASNAKLIDGLLGKDGATPAPAESPEIATLRERFGDAVKILRHSRAATSGSGLSRLAALGSSRYLYQLPWYVFIGAPGSGKTTALINSGLRFPLADKLGTHQIKGVGGTRNCDWWFADEAVLIDTAGRYTTQDSDAAADREAWQGFLKLLRKYRPRQPLNGVLLTISLGDLLAQTESEANRHAEALRARVQELYAQLGVRLPVYVLVTKADLVAGFNEFFASLTKEGRDQVWGVTFPNPEAGDAEALQGLPEQLAALHERVSGQLISRLQEEADLNQRGLIAAFDQQFSLASRLLDSFLQKVFASSGYDHPLMVRGVYFTSGTQEGNPIDRVMASLGGAFGLERRVLPPPAGSGKSFFLTRLLKDVIFAEQRIGGTNLKWERRRSLVHTGALAAMAVLAVGLMVGWSFSYLRNSSYVDEVDAAIEAARPLLGQTGTATDGELRGTLDVLEAVRKLPATAARPQGETPAGMGLGLFQGDKLDAAAEQAYRGLLRDVLLPRIARRIEAQLHNQDGTNLEFTYETLKAYLMLHEPAHFDAEALKAWVTLDWDRNLPREMNADQRAALGVHLNQLFADGPVASPVQRDPSLISNARETLLRYSLPDRIYSRLKRQGVGTDIPAFTIERAAGPGSTLVFTRKSGAPLTRGIDGLYTFDGYHKGFAKAVDAVAAKLAEEESWVLGTRRDSTSDRSPATVARDVRRLYLTDYARQWEALLADISLVRSPGLGQSIQVARVLSGADSPLPRLMRAISRETTLTLPEGQKSISDKAGEKLASAKQELGKLLGAAAATDGGSPEARGGQPDRLESIVDDRFVQIRQLVTGEAKNAPIDAVTQLLNDVYVQLSATETAIKDKVAPPPGDAAARVKAESARLPEPLRSMLQQLSSAGTSQSLAATRENLSSAVGAQVGQFCHMATDGRYPFVRGSNRDVTREDFARLFAPGGLMDDFFQKNLAPYVDTSTRTWSFKKVQEQSLGGPGNLAQFQRAATIRDVFFRSGGTVRLDFKPLEMDPAITQFTLDVDGQLVKYAHGPQLAQSIQWPGSKGGISTRIQITPPAPSGASGLSTEGPWALFRLFDKARVEGLGAPEKFKVTFDVEGRQASFEVTASSVQNPFRLRELSEFRCPGGL
jgi:type VI secretion system protein ImpL